MEKDWIKNQWAILLCSVGLFVFFCAVEYAQTGSQKPHTRPAVAVEVKGEVARPGIYLLDPAAATVGVAAAKAGARVEIPKGEAERNLLSGQSLEIGGEKKGAAIKLGRMPGAALLALGLRLDLNSASPGELLLVPRMRPAIAAQVVAGRSRKPWASVDELREIRGVGPKTVQTFREYLEVPGGPDRNEGRQK